MSRSALLDRLLAEGRPRWRTTLVLVAVLIAVAFLGRWVLFPDSAPKSLPAAAVGASSSHAFLFRPHDPPRSVVNVAFQDAREGKRTLADFRGKVVLLNLWATWCTPCREEMPTLDRLQARLGGKAFEVVALSIDRDGVPVVQRFFAETNVHALAIYVDSSMTAMEKLGIIGVPTTLLIDREGREIARWAGPAAWDRPEVVAVIETYLTARDP